jgi:hypothetical protein
MHVAFGLRLLDEDSRIGGETGKPTYHVAVERDDSAESDWFFELSNCQFLDADCNEILRLDSNSSHAAQRRAPAAIVETRDQAPVTDQ